MNDKVLIRFAGVDTIPQQVELFNRVFGASASPETWRYKHFSSILDSVHTVIGAYDGDRLVGISAFMPMIYRYQNTIIKAIQPCDSAVDSTYRRQGIYSKILAYAEKYYTEQHYDVLLAFPYAGRKSFEAFLAIGWINITDISHLYIPCSITKIIANKFHLKLPSFVDKFVFRSRMKIEKLAKQHGTMQLYESNPLQDELIDEDLLEKEYKIMFSANIKVLNWKTNRKGYLFYSVKENNNVLAVFIVYRDSDDIAVKQVEIVASYKNISVASGKYLIAYAMVLERLQQDAAILYVWKMKAGEEQNNLKRLGFIENHRSRHGIHFIIKALTTEPDKLQIINDATLWCPQKIELDTIIKL